MLVANSVYGDPRVRRESLALAEKGYQVTVGGIATLSQHPQGAELPGVNVLLANPSWLHERLRRFAQQRRQPPAAPARRRSGGGTRHSLLRSLNGVLHFAAATTSLLAHRQSIEQIEPDVIHAHDLNALSPAVRLARAVGARVVYDSHEVFSEMGSYSLWYRKWLRATERRLLRKVAAVITVSEGIADLFVDWYGIPRPRVLLNVPQAAPPDAAPARHVGGVSFLYQGGLLRARGLELLLDAFAVLPTDCQATLTIRGFGSLGRELAARAQSQELQGRVRVVDPVPPDRVVAAATAHDVGVIPFLPDNLNHVLALPNKLFEYLSAGLCIWSVDNLVEVSRLLQDIDCGRTYQPDGPDSVAQQLQTLLAQDIYQMRSNALRAARQRFNWDEEKKTLLEIYRAV